HDLQGHHLQVIALQLELAERLLPRDPDAGMEQLRAARVSVDEARQPLDQLRSFRPDVAEPADFDDFWARTLAESRALATAPVVQ
ncbi:histidine kinase, partial [Bacillus sp. SIMBA_008]|uniref:histidine kinase n=1 Tax=Bacillus sp. SIMBA_008 TaxID=3085757 RepID=UPI003979C321